MKARPDSRLYTIISVATLVFGYTVFDYHPYYEIASREYEQITEEYLQHIANMEWEKSYEYLSKDVVFRMPDGDRETRTSFIGIDQVKNFWNNYEQISGNDKAVFNDFVHIPIRAKAMNKQVGMTGVFDLCYFSAALSYGTNTANVRMHWAFHFNEDRKIDGIYSYYDRTPIIEMAQKNFLNTKPKNINEEMVVQYIKLRSDLPEDILIEKATTRAEQFKAIPGLIQKYYVRLSEPGTYGGLYIWDSREAMQAFKSSELAASIPQAYEVVDKPQVEISDLLFILRD